MTFLKDLIPNSWLKFVRPYYHGFIAMVAGVYFGWPSQKLVVVGITGTAGKSTTAAMISRILNSDGKKCGYITTVNFFDGSTDYLNKHGLSMPGGWLLQKQLAKMVAAGCGYAIVECTSEGLTQNRHLGINFDVVVFTNLSHAHLEAHGSYGNYQAAKSRLFLALQSASKKDFFPKKMIGVNLDDPMSGMFISFAADEKFGVTFKNIVVRGANKVYHAALSSGDAATKFNLDGVPFSLDLLGDFNAQNGALAAACANMLGVSLEKSSQALKNLHNIRGRMETVPNNLGITIIVDYGCEPASFKAAVEAAAQLPHNRLIHVFGATGGHRDVSKRFAFGKTSAQYADYIIITNDDVYDSDPKRIADNIKIGINQFALRKPGYEIVLDRRSAMAKALSVAKKGDIILLAGKGSEQFLSLPGNKRIDWDEVSVIREELAKLSK